MHWGVMTWVGNAGGCLVGMVPIALPLSIILTIVTLFTGIWAMVLGVRAGKETGASAQDRRHGRLGFWLGAAHIVIVVIGAIAVGWGVSQGIFAEFGVLPTAD